MKRQKLRRRTRAQAAEETRRLVLSGPVGHGKMLQTAGRATGCKVVAASLAAGASCTIGILLDAAAAAVFMAASTIIVAINARFLRVEK